MSIDRVCITANKFNIIPKVLVADFFSFIGAEVVETDYQTKINPEFYQKSFINIYIIDKVEDVNCIRITNKNENIIIMNEEIDIPIEEQIVIKYNKNKKEELLKEIIECLEKTNNIEKSLHIKEVKDELDFLIKIFIKHNITKLNIIKKTTSAKQFKLICEEIIPKYYIINDEISAKINDNSFYLYRAFLNILDQMYYIDNGNITWHFSVESEKLLIDELLKKHPKDFFLLNRKIKFLKLRKDDYWGLATKVINNNLSNRETFIGRAKDLSERHHYKEALKQYKKIYKDNPNDYKLFYQIITLKRKLISNGFFENYKKENGKIANNVIKIINNHLSKLYNHTISPDEFYYTLWFCYTYGDIKLFYDPIDKYEGQKQFYMVREYLKLYEENKFVTTIADEETEIIVRRNLEKMLECIINFSKKHGDPFVRIYKKNTRIF